MEEQRSKVQDYLRLTVGGHFLRARFLLAPLSRTCVGPHAWAQVPPMRMAGTESHMFSCGSSCARS